MGTPVCVLQERFAIPVPFIAPGIDAFLRVKATINARVGVMEHPLGPGTAFAPTVTVTTQSVILTCACVERRESDQRKRS